MYNPFSSAWNVLAELVYQLNHVYIWQIESAGINISLLEVCTYTFMIGMVNSAMRTIARAKEK